MTETPQDRARRAALADALRQEFDATLDVRVERFLRAEHHPIVSNTPFAVASSECVDLFRDGHFYGCISLCQAVGEALVRHMCDCNSCRPASEFEKNVTALRRRGFIDEEFEQLSDRLWQKRHDYHHLNPSVATDREELEELALAKIRTLAAIERWTFEYSIHEGKLHPKRPQYWRKLDGGKLEVFLRLSP
jgi:hypothetical protein